jgi:predicted NBD/HSP70 family sugar kinase
MTNTRFTPTGSSNYIGVDIGGTNTRIGVFESLDTPDFVHLARFQTYQSYEEQLHHTIIAIRAGNINHLAGIGVSIAARIAKDRRSVSVAPNLPEYVDRPFAEDLVEQLKSCSACALTVFVVCWLKVIRYPASNR